LRLYFYTRIHAADGAILAEFAGEPRKSAMSLRQYSLKIGHCFAGEGRLPMLSGVKTPEVAGTSGERCGKADPFAKAGGRAAKKRPSCDT
jgi:hypothetical protein